MLTPARARHTGGVEPRQAAALQNLSRRLDYGLPGGARSRLPRPAALYSHRHLARLRKRMPRPSLVGQCRASIKRKTLMTDDQARREVGAAIFAEDDVANCYYARPAYAPALYDFLLTQVAGRARALDLGCRPGKVAMVLADHFAEVVALDPSAPMIKLVQRRPAGRRAQHPLDQRTGGNLYGRGGLRSGHRRNLDPLAGSRRQPVPKTGRLDPDPGGAHRLSPLPGAAAALVAGGRFLDRLS